MVTFDVLSAAELLSEPALKSLPEVLYELSPAGAVFVFPNTTVSAGKFSWPESA